MKIYAVVLLFSPLIELPSFTSGFCWADMDPGSARPDLAIFLQDLAGGGAERMMVNLAAGLADRGLRVDLVLTRKEGPYLAGVDPSVRVVDLGARRVMTALWPLARYLRRERPRALLSTLVHANVAALLARQLSGVPVPVIVREASHMSSNRRHVAHWPIRLAYRVAPMVYRLADRIVAVSEGVADDAAVCLRVPRGRLEVVYNPVVDQQLLEAAGQPPDHPWLVDGAPPTFLNVGRLIEQKDQATLLRAFARVREGTEARLIILGEGPLRHQLEDLAMSLGIASDVALPGFVDNPFAYMARSASLIVSSRWEGLPGVLIQAMACNIPVISTDCPSGPGEVLQGGRFGRLVPVGDDVSMAAAMEAVLRSPGSEEGASRRAAEFSVERAAGRYGEIIAEVVRTGPLRA